VVFDSDENTSFTVVPCVPRPHGEDAGETSVKTEIEQNTELYRRSRPSASGLDPEAVHINTEIVKSDRVHRAFYLVDDALCIREFRRDVAVVRKVFLSASIVELVPQGGVCGQPLEQALPIPLASGCGSVLVRALWPVAHVLAVSFSFCKHWDCRRGRAVWYGSAVTASSHG